MEKLYHTGCIDKVFSPVWVIICLLILLLIEKKCDTGHIDVVSAEYESSYVCQELSSVKMISHIACIDMVSPQYEPSYVC